MLRKAINEINEVTMILLLVILIVSAPCVIALKSINFPFGNSCGKVRLKQIFMQMTSESKIMLPNSVNRLYQNLRTDKTLRGIVLLPELAFTPEEQDQLISSIFETCNFEVIHRDHLETVLENSRFFSVLPYIFDKNIVVSLQHDSDLGRDDISLLSKFYKFIAKRREVLKALEKQNRLDVREDLDHAIIFHLSDSHVNDHMIRLPLIPPSHNDEV